MAARFGFASSRGHSILGLVASALCVAALLLSPQAVSGQYRLFGTEGFRIGRMEIGFGADYLSELQKSLTISSSSGTVTVHDLEDGSTVTGPLGSDPRLLNRKFDIEWEMDGPGVLIPVSGSLGTGWGRVQTSFSLQVREGDFDLRFLNQREQEPDDSLHGRGTFYGAELGVAALCEDCPWFAKSGFLFQKLAGADAERSPSFASPGLQVLGDDTRLSRETRDAFARFGYSFSGKDIVTYTGVRHRWADVEVEDELRLFDPQFNQETTMRSRTKLDGSATEGIVGLEASRGSFIGRTEITFNSEDYGILAAVVYAGPARPPEEPPQEYLEAAKQLRRLHTEFQGEVNALPEIVELETVKALLNRTEERLLSILNHLGLMEMQDWVRYRFREIRESLLSHLVAPGATAHSLGGSRRRILIAALRPSRSILTNKSLVQAAQGDRKAITLRTVVLDVIDRIAEVLENNDVIVDLCIKSRPDGARITIRAPSLSRGFVKLTNDRERVRRGLYGYEISYKGQVTNCLTNSLDPPNNCQFLDLLARDRPLVRCNLTERFCDVHKEPRGRWNCEAEEP